MTTYHDVYQDWMADKQGFWRRASEDVEWFEKPSITFDQSIPPSGRWFPDGVCNTCHNALDRHVQDGRGDQLAIIYDSPVNGVKSTFSYADLLHEVKACAISLIDLGVSAGDRVLIYMPMVPEAIIGMLACARIGAIHSVVFGGFAARELAMRIDDAKPKVILSASCGIEVDRTVAYKPLLDQAIEHAQHAPTACIILQRSRLIADLVTERDHDWALLRQRARAELDAGREANCKPLPAGHPLYILYTSGTTSKPKGVVRDNGGHMVALLWSMKSIYNMRPGDVFWAASDVGWVVGHSYMTYGPLLAGCTTVIYEGKPVGTPDAGAFWRVIEEYGVKTLFTAPTALRAVRKEDPGATLLNERDISSLAALFLAGERADPDTVRWAETVLRLPIVDHWWQTETGWSIAANPVGLGVLPIKHGSPTVPMPGYQIEVIDEQLRPLARDQLGSIAIKLPLPPGAAVTLWDGDVRFRRSYLETIPGYYDTADAGFIDNDGYVWVMGRTDDVINVAGHRLSTGAMEEIVSAHPAVAECAVIGCKDQLKGEVPCCLFVLKRGASRPAGDIASEIVSLVREKIGPVAALKRAIAVARLPKTRSGKILRATIKQIADGEHYPMPATIEEPAALTEIEEAFRQTIGQVSRQSAVDAQHVTASLLKDNSHDNFLSAKIIGHGHIP